MAGAAKIGADRLRGLLDESQIDFDALAEDILTRSETLMRRRIEEIPDGVYEYGLDIDGYIEKAHLHVDRRDSRRRRLRSTTRAARRSGPTPRSTTAYNSTYATSMYPVQVRACAGDAEQRRAVPADPRHCA